MKVPSLCPCCHRPLLNESLLTPGAASWRKICDKYVDHYICIATIPGRDNEIKRLTIRLKNGEGTTSQLITWKPEEKKCWVHYTWDLDKEYQLPYWEPDMSDYSKLLAKVKLYLIFS